MPWLAVASEEGRRVGGKRRGCNWNGYVLHTPRETCDSPRLRDPSEVSKCKLFLCKCRQSISTSSSASCPTPPPPLSIPSSPLWPYTTLTPCIAASCHGWVALSRFVAVVADSDSDSDSVSDSFQHFAHPLLVSEVNDIARSLSTVNQLKWPPSISPQSPCLLSCLPPNFLLGLLHNPFVNIVLDNFNRMPALWTLTGAPVHP